MIGYPFNSSNGYSVITGCRSCSLLGSNQEQGSSHNCTKNCEKLVQTPFPLTLFDRSERFTNIRVSVFNHLIVTYMHLHGREDIQEVYMDVMVQLTDNLYSILFIVCLLIPTNGICKIIINEDHAVLSVCVYHLICMSLETCFLIGPLYL